MAEIEEGLVAILEADAGVGALADDRIYPNRLPQGLDLDTAAIRYSLVSAPEIDTLEDGSVIVDARYQFDAFARDYPTAARLGYAIARALRGYRGDAGLGLKIRAIRMVGALDSYDTDTERDRRIVEARVMYEEGP